MFAEEVAKNRLISWREIRLAEPVGAGAGGMVFRATWVRTEVAVKILKPGTGGTSAEAAREIEALRAENALMTELRHPSWLKIAPVMSATAVHSPRLGYRRPQSSLQVPDGSVGATATVVEAPWRQDLLRV